MHSTQCQPQSLYNNQIGNAGLKDLADALANGALPKLEELYLFGNTATAAAMQAVKEVVKERASPPREVH